MIAHHHLVSYLLANGCCLSVDGGGDEWDLVKSKSFDLVVDAIEAVYEAHLIIHKDEKRVAWAFVIPYGVGPDETVADWNDCDLLNQWFEKFEETSNGE